MCCGVFHLTGGKGGGTQIYAPLLEKNYNSYLKKKEKH